MMPEGCIKDVHTAIKANCATGDLIQYMAVRKWTNYKYTAAQTSAAISMFADNIGKDKKSHIAIFRVRI